MVGNMIHLPSANSDYFQILSGISDLSCWNFFSVEYFETVTNK